jgi:hypothetical protein
MKRSQSVKAPRRAQKPMSREARTARAEIQQAVKHLETSIGVIQQGLRKAERKLEADARARIRELRKDARGQLAVLKSKQREAAGTVKRVSAAASGSWVDVREMVDSVLVDVRATAAAAVKRFRTALGT